MFAMPGRLSAGTRKSFAPDPGTIDWLDCGGYGACQANPDSGEKGDGVMAANFTEDEVRAHLEAEGSGLVTLGDGNYHVVNPDSDTGDVERMRIDGLDNPTGEPVVWTLGEAANWAGIGV
jgi:hypothetical protein